MTPRKAIRKYCLWCCNDQTNEVKLCPKEDCSLWSHRESHGSGSKVKPIRARCLDCSDGLAEVKGCTFEDDCPLWPYRMGKNPKLTGKGKGRIPGFMKTGIATPLESKSIPQNPQVSTLKRTNLVGA